MERRLFVLLALVLIPAAMAAAFGRSEVLPPAVTLSLGETTYLSPVGQDGVQDEASWSVSIAAGERMVVKGYRIIVTDESGDEVYRFEEFNPARQPFIFRFKRPVVLPETMSWSGIATDGTDVPEGSYDIVVEGVDDRDRLGTSALYRVVVDNTPPAATAALPYRVFSPNADGNKDILVVEQSGTVESAWTGTFISSAGEQVFARNWSQAAPDNLVWDGMLADGQAAPDATYRYVLAATDLAGNSFSTALDGVVIDTKDTPISLARDVGFFSPNGDGTIDTVAFTFTVPVTDGVREWTFVILDATGAVRRTESGQIVPKDLVFDGRNDTGTVLPQGSYSGLLSVVYLNGNNPTAGSAEFALDVTPPSISVTAETRVFSPNGDGRVDTVQLFQESSREELWTGRVYNSAGESIFQIDWRTQAEWSMVWDGKNNDGETVADGEYRYVVSSRDRAGNYAEATVNSIRVDTRETPIALTADGSHFSPNADGVRDSLAFVPDIADPTGVVGVTLVVTDAAGNTIRRFERNTPGGQFVWAGKNNANQAAPDGSYNAELSVQYENGNNPTARLGPVVIDRARPRAEVNASVQVFSPDGDGNLDTIEILQTASTAEDTWTGTFSSHAGQIVRVYQWTGLSESFVWDGTDGDGNRVEDGIYRYSLTSTDKAGNTGEYSVDRLTIDTRPTPVAVRIGSSAFSPDGNGVKDALLITPVLEISDNIERWSLEILDGRAAVRRTLSGTGTIPESLSFDGKDDSGRTLAQGLYTARLSVLYLNGNRPTESSPVFEVDVTRPEATVSAISDLFSPNGDGRKDTLVFNQSGSQEETWTGRVSNAGGATVREFTWRGNLESTLAWDGKDNDGRPVADGMYAYSVSATDRAGNAGASGVVNVRVDNRQTSVSLPFSPAFFSPNGDGINESVIITPVLSLNEGIVSYRLDVVDRSGAVIRTVRGTGSVPSRLTWPGRTESGARANDGVYTARLTVEYAKGDQPEARTTDIVIDTRTPQATLRAPQSIFSPEGDGRKDSIVIEQETSVEDLWEAAVYDQDGQIVRTAFWSGAAEAFVWNGSDNDGSVVPDGVYRYDLRATDRAGNSVTQSIPEIRVDTRVTSAFVNPAVSAITPNGDGTLDSVRINLYPSLREGVSRWSLVMLDQTGREVRDLTSGAQRTVPASVTWDGRSTGDRVVDGAYTPKLTIEYEKGNLVESRSLTPVLVDVSGPTFTVQTAPTPFSPDGDGENDVVRISISRVTDASAVASWQVRILDPYDKVFYERRGTGAPPASFEWNGLSADGELVQAAEDYGVSVALTDSLGNVREQTVVLPIDVLVIREGDTLKIRISSIQFAPNSADLVGSDPDVAARNMRTLTRLAEILRKYSAYQIRIEGHAVSVFWDNATRAAREEREELQPLSKARADTVKLALVNLGIPAARMTTAGVGGQQPIVPHGDLDNRWKNRRVEFVLIR